MLQGKPGQPTYRFQVTGLDDKWTNYLIEKVAQRFGTAGKVKKDSILDDTTTHLIVGHQRRTEKLLSGMDSLTLQLQIFLWISQQRHKGPRTKLNT